MRREPPMRTLRSFLFNVRALGLVWWTRCAIQNAWLSLTGGLDDHYDSLQDELDVRLKDVTDEFIARGLEPADICAALERRTGSILEAMSS